MEADEKAPAEPPGAPTGTPIGDPPAPGVPDSTFTVLYIEDTLPNFKLVERVLERLPGIRLVHATEGAAGIDLAEAIRPGMVLLDLHLPDMHGQDVLSRLRAEPATRDIPVFVVSADATPARIAALRSQGVDEYLTKPLDIARLLDLVRARAAAV